MPRLPERRVVAHPHHLYVAWSALCNLQLDVQKGTVQTCVFQISPWLELKNRLSTFLSFAKILHWGALTVWLLPRRMMKNGKENGPCRAMSGHVGPCRAMCLGLHIGFLRLFLESSELQSSIHTELSRAEPSKQKTTRRSFRLGLGWRMLKTCISCITRNSNREALATIWLGASIHRFTRGQAFDWKVQGIVKGSWSYMLLSRVKIPKKILYNWHSTLHHNTRTYQILMLLFTVRWYWKVWWDAGRLIVTGERDEEVKTIAVWFLIPKMKESEGTLDLNVLDFFWQLDYMYLIWSILKVRLIHWCLQPRTRCSGTTSKGEWQLKPESCANLRRKKSREGVP